MFAIMRKEGTLLMHILGLVVLPLMTVLFFVTLLDEGQPQNLPVGIVDQDNSSTTRTLVRRLDAFQSVAVAAHYATPTEARRAIQQGEIYGFLYFPAGTTQQLLSSRQPAISFYYNSTSLMAGALVFRDLKTISTLAGAAVGQATLRAKGATDGQIRTFLQPIMVDAHNIGNPWINYNVYISTTLVPCAIMLFIMLLTAYSLGMMLKHGTGRELLQRHSIWRVLAWRLLPQMVVFNLVMLIFEYIIYVHLGFPHPGGMGNILLLGFLLTTAGQGFGILAFEFIPSVRMSMSVCSLWSVLSFSMVGLAFPAMAMDAPLQALTYIFPMRHYFLIYSTCIFNAYPLADVLWSVLNLVLCSLIPLLFIPRIKRIYQTYEYVE